MIVCDFIGIDFEPAMLRHWEVTDQVVGWRRSHPWMQTAYEPLQDTRFKKYFSVFREEQRADIEEHLLWGGRVRRIMAPDSSAGEHRIIPAV